MEIKNTSVNLEARIFFSFTMKSSPSLKDIQLRLQFLDDYFSTTNYHLEHLHGQKNTHS